jgi:outer membrane receptor protein involved in Fe transport
MPPSRLDPRRHGPRLIGRVVGAIVVSWLAATSASAQQSPPAPANPPPNNAPITPTDQQQTVTVVAARPVYRSTIDRRVYSIAGDLQQNTGSLADVLRNLPAVQVDMDGNVSLRGDPSVTILVDGKPSALFSGPGRAQALQSISPNQYESVEVMTNPPAGVTAEGTGGVINLISKAPPKAGAAPSSSGSIKANAGTGDRFEVGADGVHTAAGLSLNGGFDLRRSAFTRDIGSNYELPGSTPGALTPAYGLEHDNNHTDVLTANGSLGYDPGPHDHLDAGINFFLAHFVQGQENSYQTGVLTGPQAVEYSAPGVRDGRYQSVSESLGLTHTLPGDGQTVSVKLQLSQIRFVTTSDTTYAYQVPAQPNQYQGLGRTADFPQLDLKVDYKTVLPNKAKLALGYEATVDWQDQENQGVQGVTPAAAVTDPAFFERFNFVQRVQAIYASYDQTIGKLDVQPGLRLETVNISTDLVSEGQAGGQHYFEAYPSLHLNYELSDTSQIKASFGRRAERPDEGQFDPFRIYASPISYFAGNPNLRPAITQSYELGYEYRQKSTDIQATVFYRDKSDLLTTVTEDIGGDALLSTWENIGHAHDLGLELVANRELVRSLSVNASIDVMHSDVDASNLGILATRSAFVTSAQVGLKWKATPRDFVQLDIDASGRQLTAQGYRGGAIFSNIGWKHQFNDRLSLVVTADNPFGVARRTIVINTPTLDEIDQRKFYSEAAFVGFTYAFGAAPKSTPNSINFGSQGQGGQ